MVGYVVAFLAGFWLNRVSQALDRIRFDNRVKRENRADAPQE